MKKVFIAGGVSIDSIIYLPEFPEPIPQTIHECRFNETIGSTGSGKALNLCRLGFDIRLHAMIGNDDFGRKAIEMLKHPNIGFKHDLSTEGTERHTNLMNAAGERISVFTQNIPENPEIDYQQFGPMIGDADFVVVNLSGYTKKILPMVKERGKPVWTDLHDYDGQNTWHSDFVKYSDFILMSSDNMPDYRPFMMRMIDEGKEMVVVTHGKKGSTGLDRHGNWFEVEAIRGVELVDSNGAGDAYFSGFLYGYSQGYNLLKCMQTGGIAGALCINSPLLFHPKLSPEIVESMYKNHFGTR
ncbi:MAG: carbohydrate kinase family protein [Bacteroidales bacterium]|nr:carbohydrate kinase family protein [Bacteroidales bacterium]